MNLTLGAIITFIVLVVLIWAIDDWIRAGVRRWQDHR